MKPRSTFEKQPGDIFLALRNRYLDHKDTMVCARVSHSFFGIFQPVKMALWLLNLVMENKYEQAEIVVSLNPLWMFEQFNYRYPNGKVERTSPLKYAVKDINTAMWKMFMSKLKNHKQQMLFLNQLDEQTVLDMTPLFQAYENRNKIFWEWMATPSPRYVKDTPTAGWLPIGDQQRELVPKHWWNEFCFKGKEGWSEYYMFHKEVAPRKRKPNNDEVLLLGPPLRNCAINFSSFHLLPNLADCGRKFTMVRGWSDYAEAKATPEIEDSSARMDCWMFKRLYQEAIDEIKNARSTLRNLSAPIKKLQNTEAKFG